MISDQSPISDSSFEALALGLNDEESYFLDLLQKTKDQKITIKYTTDGLDVENFASFSSYYTMSEIVHLLERLCSIRVLEKKEKGSILLCPKCNSHTSISVISCPKCNSTKISLKEELTHPDCNYSGPREEFADGVLLRCPNCECALNEGVQKEEPEYFSVNDPYFICQDCGTKVNQNHFLLFCLKCNHKFSTIQANTLSMTSYSIKSNIQINQGNSEKPLKDNTPPKRKDEKTKIPTTTKAKKQLSSNESDKQLHDTISMIVNGEKAKVEAGPLAGKIDKTPSPSSTITPKNNTPSETPTYYTQKKWKKLPKAEVTETKILEKKYHWWKVGEENEQTDRTKDEVTDTLPSKKVKAKKNSDAAKKMREKNEK